MFGRNKYCNFTVAECAITRVHLLQFLCRPGLNPRIVIL